MSDNLKWVLKEEKGGRGSGHWGHAGDPPHRGGSVAGGGHWTLVKVKCPINNPVAVEICQRLTAAAEKRGEFPTTAEVKKHNRYLKSMSHEEKVDYIIEKKLKSASKKLNAEAEPVLRKVLEDLPDGHLDLIRATQFKLARKWPEESDYTSEDTAGTFSSMNNVVTVLDKYNDPGVWAHEIGHAVHYKTESQIGGYYQNTGLWGATWSSLKKHMPTNYARTDAAEGFAECYEYYCKGAIFKYQMNHELVQIFDRVFSEPPKKWGDYMQ